MGAAEKIEDLSVSFRVVLSQLTYKELLELLEKEEHFLDARKLTIKLIKEEQARRLS